VGCVLVRERTVVATGYNGSLRGMPHCDEAGCAVKAGCTRTIHAEANAIYQAARTGAALDGTTAYVTTMPCFECMKALLQVGVVKVVYAEEYRDGTAADMAAAAGVQMEKLS
jgi:dCMP deaminase